MGGWVVGLIGNNANSASVEVEVEVEVEAELGNYIFWLKFFLTFFSSTTFRLG